MEYGNKKALYKKVLIIFLSWLLIINLLALIVRNRLNLTSDTAYNWINQSEFVQDHGWDFMSLHVNWDSSWYIDIAEHGYHFQPGDVLANIVFFPMYPLLMVMLSLVTLGNFVLAGWVVSCVALFGALIYFHKLTNKFHKNIDPFQAIIFLLIFPTAFFLNTIYTESLFLFFSVAGFYYALKKNFLLAGIFGMCAALTRITGVLLLIPFLWEYIETYRKTHIFDKKAIALSLIPLGTLSFFVFHYLKFNDFLLFFSIERNWGRSFTLNQEHFSLLTGPAVSNFLLDGAFALFAIFVTYLAFKKLRISYGLYMAATIIVALSTGTLMSIGRYILVLFPMYLAMASIKQEHIRQAYTFTSILLLGLNILLFVNGYWAG